MSKKRTFYMYLLSITLIGCQNINTTSSYKVEDKKVNLSNKLNQNSKVDFFKKKNIQENDLGVTYLGNWSNPTPNGHSTNLINDVESGFMSKSLVESISSIPAGWSKEVISTSSSGTLTTSNGLPKNNFNTGIKSTGFIFSSVPAEGTIPAYTLSDGQPALLENNGSSSNTAIIRNLRYNVGSNSYPWSPNIPDGWTSKTTSTGETFTYNYNRQRQDTSVTFEFTGSNIEIYVKNGLDPGWNSVKVSLFKETANNSGIYETNPFKVIEGNFEPASKNIRLDGLYKGNYKAKLESTSFSRNNLIYGGKESFLYAFDKVLVYPSSQYSFTAKNFIYKMKKASDLGEIKLSLIDKATGNLHYSTVIDQYSSITTFETFDVTYSKDESFDVIIEALGTKNNYSSGTGFSIVDLTHLPELKSPKFRGHHLALMLQKGPEYGKVDLYINGQKNETIDLYNPTLIYDVKKIDNLDTSQEYDFSLVPSYELNKINGLNRFKVNLDAFGSSTAIFPLVNTALNTTGKLTYSGVKGKQYGRVKITLLDENLNYGNFGFIIGNLYSSNESIIKEFENIQFTGLEQDKKYNLIVEPDYSNSSGSNKYSINIDEIKGEGTPSSSLGTVSNSTSVSSIDQVCEP